MNLIETHEKNLAWIDERVGWLIEGEVFTRSMRANRKVMERHGPDEYGSCSVCLGIWQNGSPLPVSTDFPCYTYTDITDGLGISE